jgi:hypothetical protein
VGKKLVKCPNERHIFRTEYGLIDGFLDEDIPRLYLVDRRYERESGRVYFYPKTNNPCCLIPSNWEGHGQARYCGPDAPSATAPDDHPLLEALYKIQYIYHEYRHWARGCRCKGCGCAVQWASEWMHEGVAAGLAQEQSE